MPRTFVLLLCIVYASCSWRPAAERAATRPSILLVTIDTLRADHVGCYGSADAETPALDRLAAGGVRFDDARSHVPLTAPSHATILTGLLPPRHGVRGNGTSHLAADAPTLAVALRDGGYRTAAVVASVVLDRSVGLNRGFEVYDDNQRVGPKSAFAYLERGASQVADAALGILDRLNGPFFLWVHFYDPHAPWVAPPPYADRHQGYDAEIAFSDAALGKVLEAATRRAGDNLVVVVVSDHGESLGEHGENQHGYTLHRGVLRVPLVVSGAGIPKGRVVATTIGLVDLAPTLADLAGVDLHGASGLSLRRYWQGGAPPAADADPALWEETLHPLFDSGWAPLRGLLSRRWHFVDAPRPELYDRAADPGDRVDVARDNAATVDELRARLHALGASLGDVPEPEAEAPATPEDKERRERLATLGYLQASVRPPPAGGRLDPKDGLPGFLAIEQAERLIARGDGRGARDLVTPFLERDPSNPRLWHTLGKARSLLGDSSGAEDAVRRSLAFSPGLEFLRYTLAEILSRKGDQRGAQAELAAIVRDNPRAVEASLMLSSMASLRHDREAAKTILLAAYRAGARDPDLLDRLGETMRVEGHEAEAQAYFAESRSLWPDDPNALFEEGQASLRAGNAAKAIESLTRCADGPRAFDCRIELARAYVVGPRDLAAARRELSAARGLVTDPKLIKEVDRRLGALDGMSP